MILIFLSFYTLFILRLCLLIRKISFFLFFELDFRINLSFDLRCFFIILLTVFQFFVTFDSFLHFICPFVVFQKLLFKTFLQDFRRFYHWVLFINWLLNLFLLLNLIFLKIVFLIELILKKVSLVYNSNRLLSRIYKLCILCNFDLAAFTLWRIIDNLFNFFSLYFLNRLNKILLLKLILLAPSLNIFRLDIFNKIILFCFLIQFSLIFETFLRKGLFNWLFSWPITFLLLRL